MANIKLLEYNQRRVTHKEKGLKEKFNEERPRSVGLLSLEKVEGEVHSRVHLPHGGQWRC